MKFTLAYYLLLAYTFGIIRPVIPLFEDTLAHIFWEGEHLATVHAHNGKDHVHLEIATSQDETKNTNDSALKNPEPVSLHLVCDCDYDFFYPSFLTVISLLERQNLQTTYKRISYPPPKC